MTMSEEPALHVVQGGNTPAGAPHAPTALVALDGGAHVQELLTRPGHHDHIVQFYEDEGFLTDRVAQFITAGLDAGAPIVIIATEAHRDGFLARLRARGAAVDAARASGQLHLLDARETLAKLMVGELPDRGRFHAVIGGVLTAIRAGHGDQPIRAYGEMVDVLWQGGNRRGAIALEELWNELARQHTFSLLCAYAIGNFGSSADAAGFAQVCGAHSHVIPTEQLASIEASHDRLREICLLEQRARSLEREVEHRKQLEQALREALSLERAAREEAERGVRFNEMFAGMLGHDLRNPLGAITMGANYIARVESGEKAIKAATRILSSAERMARMIDQLLDFTRIRVGGGLALHRTRLDLAELCAKIKEELEAANPECNIGLETVGNTIGEWDYDRLLQVFSNLVGNAIAHGASSCRVRIVADGSRAASVIALVHNEGAVAPEVLPVMFEPFRGTSKAQKTKGLGLGLYITKQIVAAHGGTIDVTSTAAEGTTIEIVLPRVAPETK
jgi:signal transduction histidine kinase